MIRYYGSRVALALASCMLLLLTLELCARIVAGEVLGTRFLIPEAGAASHGSGARGWHWSPDFFRPDARLGWVPRAHAEASGVELGWTRSSSIPGTYRRARVTTLEHGLRSNGSSSQPPQRPRILAAGDSFTFGGRVSDHQTWPALLAELLAVRVLNGGVPAYGLDQSILRAEGLTATYAPDLLVLSFINEDLRRAMSPIFQRARKPFHRVVLGRLVRFEPDHDGPEVALDGLRRTLGYSYLADRLMRHVAPDYWMLGRAGSSASRTAVGCLLMQRLETLKTKFGTEVLVVLQQARPGELPGIGPAVLACAAERGLETLDLFPHLARVAQNDRERYEGFFFDHMTPSGNRFVAERLAAEIRAAGWIGDSRGRVR